MSYRYWVIRFSSDVARGEFVNVGVVCGRDGADWLSRFDLRAVRGRGATSTELRDLRPWVTWFENQISGVVRLREDDSPRVDGGWMNALRVRQAGSVQLSEGLPVDVRSARDGVDLLFPMLVERPAPVRRAARTRRSMRFQVRDALLDTHLELGRTLLDRPLVSVGLQSERFDLGLQPDGLTQFANMWAFNISTLDDLERDIRSWNYVVGRLRENGGELHRAPRATSVSETVAISVILDPPSADAPDRTHDIFAAANEAWRLNDVRAHTLDDYLGEVENGNVLTTV